MLLNDEDGMVNDNEELTYLARNYFINLFSASPRVDPSPITNHMECKVTPEMNFSLLVPFTK